MAPRRSDPCPCGSGRKHKHCCGSAAALAAELTGLRERVRRAAAAAAICEVDAFPLLISFEDPGVRRPVALLVVADELVVHHDSCPRSRGNPGKWPARWSEGSSPRHGRLEPSRRPSA